MLNGVLAAPLMVVIMLVATNRRVMGRLTLPRSLAVTGWLATAVMATATAGLFLL